MVLSLTSTQQQIDIADDKLGREGLLDHPQQPMDWRCDRENVKFKNSIKNVKSSIATMILLLPEARQNSSATTASCTE